jgi:hypothetical protein
MSGVNLPAWPALMPEDLAAAYLGMSGHSLRALVAAGVLKPPVRPFAAIQKSGAKGEGDGRYDRDDLDAFRLVLRAHRDAVSAVASAVSRGEPAPREALKALGASSDRASRSSGAA